MNYPPDSKVWCPMCRGWVLLNRREEHNRTVHVDIWKKVGICKHTRRRRW